MVQLGMINDVQGNLEYSLFHVLHLVYICDPFFIVFTEIRGNPYRVVYPSDLYKMYNSLVSAHCRLNSYPK